jgi:hypothetical protein
LFEAEQTRLCWFQMLAQMSEPARMSEIAGGDKINALDCRPSRHAGQGAAFAGGAGVMRVDVEVGDEGHEEVIYCFFG